MLPLTPTNELEAVNIMLAVIGEAPVNQLGSSDSPVSAYVSMAASRLRNACREAQLPGLWFNTEGDYPLPVNDGGNVIVPANAVRVLVDPTTVDSDTVLPRGNKLYNLTKHTDRFAAGVKAAITFLLPFEQLPEVVRTYIVVHAARQFCDNAVGSDTLHGFTLADEQKAWFDLKQEECEMSGYNILSSPGVAEVLQR